MIITEERTAREEFAEEFPDGHFVAAALDQDVEHVASVINGAPQLLGLTVDLKEHLIQVPRVTGLGTPPA